MKLAGERVLQAPREVVWSALNDAEVLRRSIPGCESMEKTDENSFHAVLAIKIGPVRARFSGKIMLTDLNPPDGYTIVGEGSGGAAGGAKGSAKVRLEPLAGGATRLTWDADAHITGKLAQIGSHLIESAANLMAGQFFDRFQQAVAGEQPGELSAYMKPVLAIAAGAAMIVAAALYLFLR